MDQLWKRSQFVTEEGDAKSAVHGQDRVVSRSTFVRFIRDSFAADTPGLLRTVDRVFELLDTKHTGVLRWSELFVALARIAGGTVAQRAAFFFSMCDTNGRGQLSAEQIKTIVRQSAEVATETRVHAEEVLTTLLGSSSGKGAAAAVSRKDFQAAVEKYPSLLSCFSMVFGVDPNNVPSEARRV